MALTLVEASKLSNDILQVGVIEKLVKDDPILERLPFKNILGNGLTYNVEATMSGANFYAVSDTWNESTSTVDQATAVTTILGGDADVDNFLKATRSDLQDLMGEQVTAKVKAVQRKFMQMFYYGYTTVDTKGFNGIQYLIRYGSTTYPDYPNTIALGTNNTTPDPTLGYDRIEEAVDMVKNGKPDLMVMSKLMRRKINVYLHSAGGITYEDRANKRVQSIFGVPVGVTDYILDTEDCDKAYESGEYGYEYTTGTAAPTSDISTSIFILQFAPEAICGLQSGSGLTTEKFDKLETKDASRVRIKWYPGLMLQNIITCSKLTGILSTGQVVAAT